MFSFQGASRQRKLHILRCRASSPAQSFRCASFRSMTGRFAPWVMSRFREDVPSKLNNETISRPLSDLRVRLDFVKPCLLRKEVIQPHLPIRLPCYDFTPIIRPTFGRALLAVRLRTSGVPDSHGVTGGVYKARERIHRGMLIRDY